MRVGGLRTKGRAPWRAHAVGLVRGRAGRVGVGGAAVHLPPIIAPFIEAMAASASSQVEKETKPKPLEMPVSCGG